MSLNSFSSKKDISSVTSLDPGSIITHSLKPSLLTKYELDWKIYKTPNIHIYCKVYPPSIVKILPVTHWAASDNK